MKGSRSGQSVYLYILVFLRSVIRYKWVKGESTEG